MNPEQENVILKRQLTTAVTALQRIKDHSTCADPSSGGCIPSYSCHHETAVGALADIERAGSDTNHAPDWGVRFTSVGDDGWLAEVYVEQQGFRLFENQNPDEDENVLEHAKWFRDMFFHALAKLGVDTSTAKERTEQG